MNKKIIFIIGGVLLVGLVVYIYLKMKKGKSIVDINQNYLTLPYINKVTENQKAFGKKVIQIGYDLGLEPNWLMIVMNNESGVNSKAKNPTSSASGLIQFTDSTAQSLGTSTYDLINMSNVDQLDYVKKYFSIYANKINNAGDAYLAVFYPYALTQSGTWTFPNWAVNANPIFFVNGKSKQDFLNYVINKYPSYYA